MSGPENQSQRIGHWRPNDSLHFHHRIHQRGDFQAGWNEPIYQYRETRLEMQPKKRSSPTFNSTALSQPDYPSNQRELKMPVSETKQKYVAKANQQRDFYLDNDSTGLPKQERMSPLKVYQKNPYNGKN